MIALVSVGLVLLVVAVVGVVLLNRDGAERWNSLVATDLETGELVVYDDQGEEVDRIDAVLDEPGRASTRGRYAIVNDGDQEAAVILDLVDGKVAWEGETVEGSSGLWWLPGSIEPIAFSGATSGGDVVLVDAEEGEETDLAAAAGLDDPLILPNSLRVSPDGRRVAAVDTTAQETVLVDIEKASAVAVSGFTADLSDDVLAVIERTETSAEVRFLDAADGEEIGSAPVPRGTLGLMLTGGEEAVGAAAEEDGGATTFEVAAGDDEVTEVAQVDVDTPSRITAYPTAGRMLLSGDADTVFLDEDGEEVARADGVPWQATSTYEPDVECVLLSHEGGMRLVELADGERLATADEVHYGPAAASLDGCVVTVSGVLVSEAETTGGEDEFWIGVAPDGTAAVVSRGEENEVVDLTDPDAEPVRIGGPVAGFATR